MAAYIIADVDVTDPTQYAQYRTLSSIAMQAYGAKPLVRGGAVEVLEGPWQPGRVVVLEFPDMDTARRFYDSPEYGAARQARESAALMRMILVQGA